MVQKELRIKILRILSLIAGIIVLSGMGTLYSYSLYAPTLKIRLNYSETEVNAVAAIGDMGVYIGAIPVGWFYDRFGPTLTFIGSGISIFSGYFLMYLALKRIVPGNAVLVGIYFWIQAMGSVASFQAGLVTNVKNFRPKHRGKATGIIFPWSKETENENFLLLHETNEEATLQETTATKRKTKDYNEKKDDEKNTTKKDDKLAEQPLTDDESSQTIPPPKFGDLSGIDLWKEPQFIILFCVIFCIGGSGLMFINILGGVVKAWQITELQTSTFVIILSLSNFIGRLIIGNTIDLIKNRVPAILLLIPSIVLMGLSHALLAFTSGVGVLLFGTIGTAMAYGGHFAAYLFCINMYFGDKHYGQNVGWSGLAVGLGGMLLAYIAGRIYDSQVLPENEDIHQCYGQTCYMYAFVTTSTMLTVALILVILLSRREKQQDNKRHLELRQKVDVLHL